MHQRNTEENRTEMFEKEGGWGVQLINDCNLIISWAHAVLVLSRTTIKSKLCKVLLSAVFSLLFFSFKCRQSINFVLEAAEEVSALS